MKKIEKDEEILSRRDYQEILLARMAGGDLYANELRLKIRKADMALDKLRVALGEKPLYCHATLHRFASNPPTTAHSIHQHHLSFIASESIPPTHKKNSVTSHSPSATCQATAHTQHNTAEE